MKRLHSLVVISILLTLNPILSQNLLNGVVKITTYDKYDTPYVGAGIISGQDGNKVFIVTAFHLVDGVDKIEVRTSQFSYEPFQAKLFEEVDKTLDVAVLIVEMPIEDQNSFYKFRDSKVDKLKKDERVICIGHPNGNDFTENTYNYLSNKDKSRDELSFTDINIRTGFSGGPILDRKKKLLGMIKAKGVNADAEAVKIETIKRLLKKWGIPFQFLLPPKPPLKKSTYLFKLASASALVYGIIQDGKGQDKIDLLNEFRDPQALLEKRGLVRTELELEPKQHFDRRNGAYIASGLFFLGCIAVNFEQFKKPVNEPSGYLNPDLFFGHSSISPTGLNLGLTMKF